MDGVFITSNLGVDQKPASQGDVNSGSKTDSIHLTKNQKSGDNYGMMKNVKINQPWSFLVRIVIGNSKNLWWRVFRGALDPHNHNHNCR